jgi:hypothetical protein
MDRLFSDFFDLFLLNKIVDLYFFFFLEQNFINRLLATISFFFILCITSIPYRHLKDIFKITFLFIRYSPPPLFDYTFSLFPLMFVKMRLSVFQHAHSYA